MIGRMAQPLDINFDDVLSNGCKFAMVALLIASGHGMIHGWQGWIFGAILSGFVIVIWSQWIAARSAKRLPNPQRLAVQIAMFVTAALYAAAGGLAWWGVAFVVIAIAATFAQSDGAH